MITAGRKTFTRSEGGSRIRRSVSSAYDSHISAAMIGLCPDSCRRRADRRRRLAAAATARLATCGTPRSALRLTASAIAAIQRCSRTGGIRVTSTSQSDFFLVCGQTVLTASHSDPDWQSRVPSCADGLNVRHSSKPLLHDLLSSPQRCHFTVLPRTLRVTN